VNGHSNELATQWTWEGLTLESIEETAAWLSERRRLGSGCEYFFSMAGRMLLHARFDYVLITPMFFHAVIGLERALRIHYKQPDERYMAGGDGSLDSFGNLFQKAVEHGVIHDDIFGELQALPGELPRQGEYESATHSEWLAWLVPKLRNDYFHGRSSLKHEFYPLTVQMRQCADALKTTGTKSLLE